MGCVCFGGGPGGCGFDLESSEHTGTSLTQEGSVRQQLRHQKEANIPALGSQGQPEASLLLVGCKFL